MAMALVEQLAIEEVAAPSVLIGASLVLMGLVMATLVGPLGRFWIPERNHFFARWGFTALAAVIGTWLLGTIIVSSLFVMVFGSDLSLGYSLAVGALGFGAPAALVFRYAKQLDPDGIACLGFRREGSVRAASFGVVAYVLLLPGLLGSTMLWPHFLQALGGDPQTQEVMRAFFDLEGTQLILPVIFAVLIMPFFEELLFRSFLQPLLVQNFREVGGVVVTSLLFASLHGLDAAGPVFVLSLILGAVMQRTQRFASCFAVHALHNGLSLWAVLTFDELREMADYGLLLPF